MIEELVKIIIGMSIATAILMGVLWVTIPGKKWWAEFLDGLIERCEMWNSVPQGPSRTLWCLDNCSSLDYRVRHWCE